MLDRIDTRAVRAACEGTGWIAREGTLSMRGASNALHVYEFAGWLRFLHFWGHNCPVLTIVAAPLSGKTPQARAEETVGFAAVEARVHLGATLTLKGVLKKAAGEERRDDFVETEVVAHFASGHASAARDVCREVLENRRRASYNHNKTDDGVTRSFFERALSWTPDTA